MKRRILAMLLTVVMLMGLAVPAFAAEPDQDMTGKTVILHTNDVHGNIKEYAKVAALRKEYEDRGASVLLVDAGDFSQGSVYVSVSKGADAIEMMKTTGYDLATLGNHEFDFGAEQLFKNLESIGSDSFDVICANVFNSQNKLVCEPVAACDLGTSGNTIGFIGLDTPEAQTKANPALIKGMKFLAEQEMYDVTTEHVNKLRSESEGGLGCDLVIALTHLGVDESSAPNRSYDLLKNVEGIDFVIDGHSHTTMDKGANGEPIQSTGAHLENVGVIVIDDATAKIEANYLVPIWHKDSNKKVVYDYTKEDPYVAAKAKEIMDRIDAEYSKVFAKTEVTLNGERDPGNRTEETNLGDLITDSMMWVIQSKEGSVKVDKDHVVAITNGGGIRASISAGDITKKDVNTVLPFGNTVSVVYVTGSELLEALEASTQDTPKSIGAFPQVCGIDFTIDTTKAYDKKADTYPGSTYHGPNSIQRVTINSINGAPFNPQDRYAVITNNFVAAGGDTYYAFAAATEQFDTGLPLDEVLMGYITVELGGVVGQAYAAPKGRIHVVTESTPEPSEPETTEPETKPTEPETKPTEPETKPTQPETKPTQPETKPTQPQKPNTGSNPKTGDEGVMMPFVICTLALCAFVVVYKKERKQG